MNIEQAKHLSEILKAYSEGKTIQYGYNNSWFDVDDFIMKNMTKYDLRVKPEEKWRPYKNAEEFIKAQKEHGLHFKSYGQFYLPLMVDREKGIVYSDINGPSLIDYQELFETWAWEDGTRCGILED